MNFFGQYKREKVFANYFSFFVTADGIQNITFNYYPVRGYTGEKQDLSYADEALLAFMREWKKGEHAEEATIDRMELAMRGWKAIPRRMALLYQSGAMLPHLSDG